MSARVRCSIRSRANASRSLTPGPALRAIASRPSSSTNDRYFEIVDTGGIGIVDDDNLEEHVEDQIRYAVARADVILFLADVRDGLTPLDVHVAEQLRRLEIPVVPVANKADDDKHLPEAAELTRLGYGEPLCISALHGRNRQALLDRIDELVGQTATEAPGIPTMKLAIVGKRNAGKSTLVNTLAGEDRVIVSEIPGTTRDAVDVQFQKDGHTFVAIDTAGVRKKTRMDDIDFYSYTRALRSIRRADVVMLLIDATVPISDVDVKLAAAIREEYKPVVLTVNKWDLAKDQASPEAYDDYLFQVLPGLDYAPMAVMTAQTGKNVGAAVDLARSLHKQGAPARFDRPPQRCPQDDSRSPRPVAQTRHEAGQDPLRHAGRGRPAHGGFLLQQPQSCHR